MNTKLGPKTQNLQKLKDLGLNVPAFVGISASDFKNLATSLDKAHHKISAKTYAVRSSALNEDSKNESMAGLFHTELNVSPDNLLEAAKKVIANAKKRVKIDEFSLIVQEFIEFDESGVCFTRDPEGTPEMIIESAAGGAEKIVQGELTPTMKRVNWNDKTETVFKSIEIAFKHPQDIEWGRKDGTLYILQSRPITTISKEDTLKIKVMETALPTGQYHWEKNELTELAPFPCKHSMDLLKQIYAAGGPVDSVYKKLGIKYTAMDFLKRLEGELYVDKRAEIQSLFPAYDLENGRLKIKRLKGLWESTINQWKLTRPKTRSALEIQQSLILELESPFKRISREEFLQKYELIFETNLLAGAMIKRLELIHKKGPSSVVVLSQGATLLGIELPHPQIKTHQWQGNTLDLSDQGKFIKLDLDTPPLSPELQKWWENLGAIQKTQYQQVLPEVLIAQHNRELGRMLVVKLKSQLDLICNHKSKNESEYPACLTTYTKRLESKLVLSPGEAKGTLTPLKDFKTQKNVILLVEELRPELIEQFSKVNGIVTRRGGLLSHLAILAREKGLPIIRDPQIDTQLIGKEYSIPTQ